MNQLCRQLVAYLFAFTSTTSTASDAVVPKPFVIAPECTEEQLGSAIAVIRPSERVIACYFLEKWSFIGAAIAMEPDEFVGRIVSDREFYQLRKRIFLEQSARLRNERDLKESMPGEPPPHAGMPFSLFIRKRLPLGVFLNESKHIGYADLVPLLAHNDQVVTREQYPLIQLETYVFVKGHVFKLIQISPIEGPGTVGEGFRMADDWARRLNGGERPASED
jgi:hypothetical protein